MTQLDKLSAESLRLEVIANPSIRDKSRMRSIEGVTEEIVKQLEEITQQRLKSSSPAMSSQPSKVQPPTSNPNKGDVFGYFHGATSAQRSYV